MIASPLKPLGGLMASMTLQSRIEEAVNAALATGKSKADIARAANVSQSALTQWLTGDTKSLKAGSADGLQRATGYLAHWLIYGKGPKKQSAIGAPQNWSPQAVAIAEQLDWITDPRRRTAAWLEASEVIQNHYRRGSDGGNGSPPSPPPTDTPPPLQTPRKQRA